MDGPEREITISKHAVEDKSWSLLKKVQRVRCMEVTMATGRTLKKVKKKTRSWLCATQLKEGKTQSKKEGAKDASKKVVPRKRILKTKLAIRRVVQSYNKFQPGRRSVEGSVKKLLRMS